MLTIKSIHIFFTHTTWRAVYCNNTLFLFPSNWNVTLVCVIWSVTTTVIIIYNLFGNMSCLNLSLYQGSPAQEMVTYFSGVDVFFVVTSSIRTKGVNAGYVLSRWFKIFFYFLTLLYHMRGRTDVLKVWEL